MPFTQVQAYRGIHRMIPELKATVADGDHPFSMDHLEDAMNAIKATWEGTAYRDAQIAAIKGVLPFIPTAAQMKIIHRETFRSVHVEDLING